MFDPRTDIVTHCVRCNTVMIVRNHEPLNEYVKSLGYKCSGRFYCHECTKRIFRGE